MNIQNLTSNEQTNVFKMENHMVLTTSLVQSLISIFMPTLGGETLKKEKLQQEPVHADQQKINEKDLEKLDSVFCQSPSSSFFLIKAVNLESRAQPKMPQASSGIAAETPTATGFEDYFKQNTIDLQSSLKLM
jgi:hypothetical protein